MSKERYDSRKLKKHSSGTSLVYRKRRMLLIAVWFFICVGISVWIYKGYSEKHMSDAPIKTVQGSVETGHELYEGVPFGPWMAWPESGQ